jgi:molybdopterin/thiamine biosynthesis adenylyltransferase
MRRWTDAYPERLAFELAEFERRGLNFTLDEPYMQRTGLVMLTGSVQHEGEEIALEVCYPDSFPFMRPEVFAPTLRLERHQNPVQHNLCLLDRSSRAWHVNDTGAWLVAERVPHLLSLLNAGGEELRAGEVPQGEPSSAYFEAQPGTVVFIPREMLGVPSEETVGLLQLAVGANERPEQALRACLSKVSVKRGHKKQTLAELTDPLRTRFAGKTVDGRWARVEKLPEGNMPRDLLAAAAAVEPALANPRWHSLPMGGEISILGVLSREEVRQGAWEDTWLFVVSLRQRNGGTGSRYITRGERLTAGDLQARLPRGARLNEKTVGVVGLGSLGAPIALELTRAQLSTLRVLDNDRVEAGNVVRWTHGLSAVGHHKCGAICGWVSADYPFTEVTGYGYRIGGVPAREQRAEGEIGEAEGVGQFLEGLDLVIDATGELGVQHLISSLSEELGLAQVYAWGTEGGWGGAVAHIRAGTGGCWHCLQLAFADGAIELPPAAPDAPIQPRGCAEPTFSAAGYQLTPIVAQASRTAARSLSGALDGSEVSVLTLQDESGELSAPRWVSYALPIHKECPCARRALLAS